MAKLGHNFGQIWPKSDFWQNSKCCVPGLSYQSSNDTFVNLIESVLDTQNIINFMTTFVERDLCKFHGVNWKLFPGCK